MNKKLLLTIGCILICFGIFKPNLSSKPIITPDNTDTIVVITPPADETLKESCQKVIEILRNGGESRAKDGKKLASLYMDLSTLISLDGENEIIKTTEEIRQANRISGLMLDMNIRGKYPDLASAANNVIVTSIGDDVVILDQSLRSKAAESFRALAWACNEGTK